MRGAGLEPARGGSRAGEGAGHHKCRCQGCGPGVGGEGPSILGLEACPTPSAGVPPVQADRQTSIMALPLSSLIRGISAQWLALLEAAEKQRARSPGACRARSTFSSEALSGVFQATWAVSPFLGDSLLCLSLEPGRGGEVHREDGSGIGVSPFEGQGSFFN